LSIVDHANKSDGKTDTEMTVFTGVGVALVTIRDAAEQPDAPATAKLAGDLVAAGMQAVLACGTTGEPDRLDDAQRRDIVAAVRAVVPAATPVIAGTGAASAKRAAALTTEAVKAGADAVLAWPPPGAADLRAYYATVRDAAAGVPVLAYHVPWVSAPGVPVEALAGLPVAGIKDSSGDPDRLLAEVAHYSGATYVGSSALLALAGPLGAAGAILAVANVAPELSAAAFGGSAAAQRDLTDVHLAVRAGGPRLLRRMLAEQR
jgi:dihydrodipicolinate synthase/N-acetylneuraminate lyase